MVLIGSEGLSFRKLRKTARRQEDASDVLNSVIAGSSGPFHRVEA